MKIFLPVIISLISISNTSFGQDLSKSWKNLNYASDTTAAHQMDIYLPKEEKDQYPAIVLIYGSAFFGNDMKDIAFETLGSPLLNAGFAVITINHRSSRDAIFPA